MLAIYGKLSEGWHEYENVSVEGSYYKPKRLGVNRICKYICLTSAEKTTEKKNEILRKYCLYQVV